MRLSVLMDGISYRLAPNSEFWGDHEIVGVTADYRDAAHGWLFVCAVNAMQDGHLRAELAYDRGCRVFLAEHPLRLPKDATVMLVEDAQMQLGELAARVLGHPARRMTVLGITGTSGKTAVAHTVTELLKACGKRAASLTSDGILLRGRRHPNSEIIPDAAKIQYILRDFADDGVEIAVLELSSYMLRQKSAFSIPFTAVLLTNLSPAHIGEGEHPDFSDYEAAKASLFRGDAPFWVFPANFVGFSTLTNRAKRLLTFGDGGDFSLSHSRAVTRKDGLGTEVVMRFENGEKHAVSLPVVGDFATENALAASALARVVDISPAEIARALSGIKPRGRMECVASYEGRYIYLDSAYDAPALKRALLTLRARTEGKLTVVVGSVGGRARGRRAALGKAATEYADLAYFTADNPNYEDVRAICEDMASEVEERDRFCVIPDRRAAIERAILEMRPHDTLLIAGKGGESFQLVNGQRLRFSERAIVRECLEELV